MNNLRDYTSWLHEYLAKEVRKSRVRWPYSPSIFSLYIHHTITSLFFVLFFVSYRILPIVQSLLFHLIIVLFTANLLDVKIQERTEGTLNMRDKDRHKFLPRSPAISDRFIPRAGPWLSNKRQGIKNQITNDPVTRTKTALIIRSNRLREEEGGNRLERVSIFQAEGVAPRHNWDMLCTQARITTREPLSSLG